MHTPARRAFVESLAAQNREFYGTPDGRGTLRAFELTFEHRWIYLFELVQNGLDAGARSIAVRLTEDGDALEFQHDGQCALEEKDIEGLSKIFRSTKGASTVGFMGIGFKSVFGRFREARVSGWGWAFRYEVAQVVGERYGDVQPDLLGAVIPIWDDTIPAPEAEFTTRFELRQRVDSKSDLRSDLAKFLADDDRTPLAILAAAGLERLDVCGKVWEPGTNEEPDGSLEATALSAGENLLWQLFPVRFAPPPKAVARFLEHRRIQPSEQERELVYAEAARERQVLGVLPLDDKGIATPPKRGRIYATLPTEVTLPFGVHINADWLLNISRTGLRELEDNTWQRVIVDHFADVLASLLRWVSRSCSKPDAAAAAFAALALPSPNGGRLEALLLEERWLERLRAELEGAAILPAWTKHIDALSFATLNDIIVPPSALSNAFGVEPALQSIALMSGPVLARGVLGPGANDLLTHAGLLHEMSPSDLEKAWAGGLEQWWNALEPNASSRRDLLFRLWGAVAELVSDDAWRAARLQCVRTAGGIWLHVDEAAFFNEALPSEHEPGGPETRRFIESYLPDVSSCIPDAWVPALRQAAAKENGRGPLSQAWDWIEEQSRSIDLREAVQAAIGALAESANPDWTVLVPLGHWVMHRQTRTDLLTHVLVESASGPKGVPITEALVADPYVERGHSRRRLFHEMPPISAAYVEQDPKGADAREWCGLFENAGAKGALRVHPLTAHARRYDRKCVAEFLGLDASEIGQANNDGYLLFDFDIAPALPKPDASEETRAALAAWLDDGFSALRGQGRRMFSYFYQVRRSSRGRQLSSWISKLSELAWVPCQDGTLRPPKDVLPRSDPAREGSPVAQLSEDLIAALEQEGLLFGAAIPNAPALRKLLALGSRLDSEDIAELLHEAREEIVSDEDAAHFQRALAQLSVPVDGGRRVPLNRIVKRVGGQLRGALGGWICPLGDIDEALRRELLDSNFPYAVPDTTTGTQALAYIREVWARARSSSEGLANEVRSILPAAYTYCAEDLADDDSLAKKWAETISEAAVFAEREWMFLAETKERIYFDDLEDRRYFPSQAHLKTATGGHLGNSPAQQRRTATALGLPPISSVVEMTWHESGAEDASDWVSRFDGICKLLARARGAEQIQQNDQIGAEAEAVLSIKRVGKLDLMVSVKGAPANRVAVNARLRSGVLIVVGKPVHFASDAAKELLRGFGFRQRGDLAADLTGMLAAIDEDSDFTLAVGKFERSFSPDSGVAAGRGGASGGNGLLGGKAESANATLPVGSQAAGKAMESESGETSQPENRGSSYNRDRALAQQAAYAEKLKKALKGELEAPKEEDDADEIAGSSGGVGGELGDEIYRAIAAQYERLHGREPELGDPHQVGWDLASIDPMTGLERLIEVKGKGVPWIDDEVVELSRAQVDRAFQTSGEDGGREWYLYVVERTKDDAYRVLPIKNPARTASKWILCGESWRLLAREPDDVVLPDLAHSSQSE